MAMKTNNENRVLELYNTAMSLEKEKRTEEAIHAYEEVLSMKDDFFETYLKLGALYENTSQEPKAEEIYKKGIQKAKFLHNETASSELSFTLFGLLDD